MNISKAIEIFNIKDVNNIDEKEIKRLFRGLMMDNHPDKGGDVERAKEINLAYDYLRNNLSDIQNGNIKEAREVVYRAPKKEEKKRCIISLFGLIDILKGNRLSLNSGDSIEKKDLPNYHVIIRVALDIEVDNQVLKFENLQLFNKFNKYTVRCRLENVVDTNIVIKIADKEIDMNLKNKRVILNVVLDNDINVAVELERVGSCGQ